MSDPNFPNPDERPQGPPQMPPQMPPQWGAPPAPGFGGPPAAPAPGQGPAQGFAQPAAQPYLGGYHGPEWIPELGMQTATAGARIGAKALDIVFFVAIQATCSVVVFFALVASSDGDGISSSFGASGGSFSATSTSAGTTVAINAVVLLVDFLYNVVLTARFGGQPGKLILGQRIVHTDGSAIAFRGALIRWSPVLALTALGWIPGVALGFVVGLLRLTLLVVNLVLVIVDDRHQSIFDRVARTYVVTAR